MVDKGIYLLVIRLDQDRDITVGSLDKITFKRGFYLYVGSAKNGLKNRISRHLRKKKKKHWHVDHLLERAKIVDVKVKTGEAEECTLAKNVSEFTETIQGFGSSDCSCAGHLFYHPMNRTDLDNDISRNLDVDDFFP